MRSHDTRQPLQHVYQRRGESERTLACSPLDPQPARAPTVADLVPVTEIMTRETFCAQPELGLDALGELFVLHRVGCIPVVNHLGEPIGMVTKLDLVEHLLRAPLSGPPTASAVMMPLAITLHERATVAHAAAVMAREDIHHVAILDEERRLIGIVSTMDITRWLAANDGLGATASR